MRRSTVIRAVARLHNFVIDNDKPPLDAIRLNADGTIDPGELGRFGVEALPVEEGVGEAAEGNLGLFGYDEMNYDNDEGTSAQRQRIVNELIAKDVRQPQDPL
jgi:hypothetical protein